MSDQAAGDRHEAEVVEQSRGSQAEAEARLRAAAPILMRGLEFLRSAHGRPEAEEPEETR